MPIKIAMIGAGSIGFTRKLMHDILAVPELSDTHFAFMDLSQQNLDMVMQLCQRDIDANKLSATITGTTSQREAITDADYTLCMIRQGGFRSNMALTSAWVTPSAPVASCMPNAPSPRCSASARIFARWASPIVSSSTTPTRWR